jgi:hypothetical protein
MQSRQLPRIVTQNSMNAAGMVVSIGIWPSDDTFRSPERSTAT